MCHLKYLPLFAQSQNCIELSSTFSPSLLSLPYPFFLTSLLFCSTLFCISIPSTKKSTQWQQPKKSEQSRTWGSTPLRSRSNISCSSAGFSLMSFLLVRCFLSFLREMNLGADFFLSLFLSLSGLVFFLYFLL